jgi:hypothetical protein
MKKAALISLVVLNCVMFIVNINPQSRRVVADWRREFSAAFGGHSAIELLSAIIVWWRFRDDEILFVAAECRKKILHNLDILFGAH